MDEDQNEERRALPQTKEYYRVQRARELRNQALKIREGKAPFPRGVQVVSFVLVCVATAGMGVLAGAHAAATFWLVGCLLLASFFSGLEIWLWRKEQRHREEAEELQREHEARYGGDA